MILEGLRYIHEASDTGEFFVYRIGSDKPTLVNRNAGTLKGLAYFISRCNEKGMSYGGYVTKYRVKNLAGKFGDYIIFRQNDNTFNKHSGDEDGQLIGRKDSNNGTEWYSFPVGGAWEADIVKTVSEEDMDKMCSDKGIDPLGSAFEPEDAMAVLKEAFK
jgi:hypothetical protein